MAHRSEAWRYLLNSDVDVALLQEAASPPADVANLIELDPAQWETAGAGVWMSAECRSLPPAMYFSVSPLEKTDVQNRIFKGRESAHNSIHLMT